MTAGAVLANTGPAASPVVEAAGVYKRFGSTQALRGIDLVLRPGRCLGLVGRNGAGKSTLVSIMSGIYPADAGELRLGGRLATVHQHSMVIPSLTVAENIFLARQPGRRGPVGWRNLIDWRGMREQAGQIMADWGYPIDVRLPCSNLTVEQRQIVEIARALAAGARCLLLDEPTAALEREAIRRLFDRVRQLVAGGVAVMYISHHLEEVFEICQDVAVIRDGEIVLATPTAEVTKEQLVSAMVGSEDPADVTRIRLRSGPVDGPIEAPCLEVDHLFAASAGGPLSDVSLTVRPGERVGVTGLLSAGVATLARAVAGAEGFAAGQVRIDGVPLVPGRRDLAMRAGIGYIPEDRQAEGFVSLLGVAENSTMTVTDWLSGKAGWLRPSTMARAAEPLSGRLSVVSAGPAQPVGELSGGNQQKVTVVRAIIRKPRLIVAITPTRGVDVASKSLLLTELAEVTAESGAGLLLATDELSDLAICDRVIVLVRGEVFTEFPNPPFDREAVIAATEGISSGAPNTTDRRRHE
jgi:simple sugar transport system ATP-binding protein